MLHKRIIPCLLFHNGGLYKTLKFKKPTYIGDPINAIRIFNEKEVDELIILDIDATRHHRGPNYKLIEEVAGECFMPFCYGGGVTSVEQMKRIYALGVEKISISSAAVMHPRLVSDAAKIFGNQSVVVTIDVKKDFWGENKVYIENGKRNTKLDVVEWAKQVASFGAGELVINSIDRDGCMQGYDCSLINAVSESVSVPVIALGGAGTLEHVKELFCTTKINAAAAGSLFVYHGPLKGVLISYPNQSKIKQLLHDA